MKWLPSVPGKEANAEAQNLLWYALVALIVGVLPFAFAPNIVEYPRVAAFGLVILAAATLLLTVPPLRHWPAVRRNLLAIAVLLCFATTLSFATGKGHSPLLVLYLLPLVATGGAFARPAWVIACGVLIAFLGCGLAAATPGMAPLAHEFAILLCSMLLPAIAVALALANQVTRARETEQRLQTLAGSDPLTGLLNLKAFDAILQQQHRRAERDGRPYSILMINVNDTALINETLGHHAGDQLIVAVAQAITRSVRQSDAAARLGGDVFVVLLVDMDARQAAQVAQRMRNHVYQGTISIGKRLLRANVSIGAAQFPDDDLLPQELMKIADQRMRQDRELRREPASA
jgi:diguanylate cyclase (GGDEF)-like protein